MQDDGAAFWGGITLILPNEPDRIFYKRNPTNVNYPAEIEYVTKDNWLAVCVQTDNGRYDGFKVFSPKGEEFLFDVTQFTPGEPAESTQAGNASVFLNRVTDRYGNYVWYTYLRKGPRFSDYAHVNFFARPNLGFTQFPYLNRIFSSDGRDVRFEYEVDQEFPGQLDESFPLLKKVSWKVDQYNYKSVDYIYSDNAIEPVGEPIGHEYDSHYLRKSLIEVNLPEGLSWKYSYNSSQLGHIWEGEIGVNTHATAKSFFNRISGLTSPSGERLEYQYQAFDKKIFGNLYYGMQFGDEDIAVTKITGEDGFREFDYSFDGDRSITEIKHFSYSGNNWVKREKLYFGRHLCAERYQSWCGATSEYHVDLIAEPWKFGLLFKHDIMDENGILLRSTENTWELSNKRFAVPINHEVYDPIQYSRYRAENRMYASEFFRVELRETTIDGKFSTRFTYDELGQPLSKLESNGDQTKVTRYEYDNRFVGHSVSAQNWRTGLVSRVWIDGESADQKKLTIAMVA